MFVAFALICASVAFTDCQPVVMPQLFASEEACGAFIADIASRLFLPDLRKVDGLRYSRHKDEVPLPIGMRLVHEVDQSLYSFVRHPCRFL